jgi:hypothetical protein
MKQIGGQSSIFLKKKENLVFEKEKPSYFFQLKGEINHEHTLHSQRYYPKHRKVDQHHLLCVELAVESRNLGMMKLKG